MLDFKTVSVNVSGQIVNTLYYKAQYYIEDLPVEYYSSNLTMIHIPQGQFWRGSSKLKESPQHKVNMASFFISQTPITQGQWKAIARKEDLKVYKKLKLNPSEFIGEELPVEKVAWEDCMEFCARLSRYTKRNYRLPSEAEWEYCCRGIINDEISFLDWQEKHNFCFHFGPTLSSVVANYDCTISYQSEPKIEWHGRTTNVKSFYPNSLGLYDMHGNVWEWCADVWHEDYRGAPNDGRVWDEERESLHLQENTPKHLTAFATNKGKHVLRGGSWFSCPQNCRSAYRRYAKANQNNIGFRVVSRLYPLNDDPKNYFAT